MDRETTRRIEDFRRNEAGPLENNLIDELVGGEMDRRSSCAASTMFGLSVGMMGSLLALAGEAAAAPSSSRAATAAKKGGTIRARHRGVRRLARAVPLERRRLARVRRHPRRVPDVHHPKGQVVPALATSWKPNADATVWTFQIRKGVKFHDG